MKNKVLNRMRQRRDAQAFARTMHDASPSMRQELLALSARKTFVG